jgi:transcriptional regulator with GAF, ATPase, and Fis domain
MTSSTRFATQTWQGVPAMAKDPYPTSAQLDALVLHMYKAGISYSEALREFKKQFVLTVLRELDWNETKAARALRMHRNTGSVAKEHQICLPAPASGRVYVVGGVRSSA